MIRTPVKSSQIASIGYDAATQTLEVSFPNGSVYQYFSVPPVVWNELQESESKGKYFNAKIKTAFKFVRQPTNPVDSKS